MQGFHDGSITATVPNYGEPLSLAGMEESLAHLHVLLAKLWRYILQAFRMIVAMKFTVDRPPAFIPCLLQLCWFSEIGDDEVTRASKNFVSCVLNRSIEVCRPSDVTNARFH